MHNLDLRAAKINPKDEFYTSYTDIDKEMYAYLNENPRLFSDASILLPCDDPRRSQFFAWFTDHFVQLGMRKLVAVSFAGAAESSDEQGRVTIVTPTLGASYKQISYSLEGDGDFRSDEVTQLRDEADFVITNPPFSLFRDFVDWLCERTCSFSVLGNMNAITCSNIFPLFQANKLWFGSTISGGDREFRVPESYPLTAAGSRVDDQGNKYVRVKGVRWFTNIGDPSDKEFLQLQTMEHNKLHSRHAFIKEHGYPEYDNYAAIEVGFTDAIPSDYTGVMGVPISFIDKYNPAQFTILGMTDRKNTSGLRTHKYTRNDDPRYNDLNARSTYWLEGKLKVAYTRILIQHNQKLTV